MSFDRNKHLYTSTAFAELLRNAVQFFGDTPIHDLSPTPVFKGTGIYALYYSGQYPAYQHYARLNGPTYVTPIYVGKAVPKGWRQSRLADNVLNQSNELHTRLREHARSINSTTNLSLNDFKCRFVIVEGEASDMISTLEAALIKQSKPLWNTIVDGFGNHDPGKGRYEQAKSDWDVIHPGRAWAEKCKGQCSTSEQVMASISAYLKTLGQTL